MLKRCLWALQLMARHMWFLCWFLITGGVDQWSSLRESCCLPLIGLLWVQSSPVNCGLQSSHWRPTNMRKCYIWRCGPTLPWCLIKVLFFRNNCCRLLNWSFCGQPQRLQPPVFTPLSIITAAAWFWTNSCCQGNTPAQDSGLSTDFLRLGSWNTWF